MRKLFFMTLLLLAVGGGVGAASALTGEMMHASDEAEHDGAPADRSQTGVAARSAAAGGGDVGIRVYRNRAGALCMAHGDVRGDRVGAANGDRFDELPMEGSSCGLRLDPVAVQVTRSRTETTMSGVARDDVTAVTVKTSAGERRVVPQAKGAFITQLPGEVAGDVVLSVRLADGTRREIKLPGAPSLDELSRGARKYAPRPDGTVPPQDHGG